MAKRKPTGVEKTKPPAAEKPKPSAAEKEFLAGLTREERSLVRSEDAGRELGRKLVVVTPELPPGQPPPSEAEIKAAQQEIYDLFVQPQIDGAIRIVLARHALPGEVEAVMNSRCLLCKMFVIAGTKARRADSGYFMHLKCVDDALARGVEWEKQAAFEKNYEKLQAIRAEEKPDRRP